MCYWGGHVARQQVRHPIHLHQFSVSHHCAIEVDTSPGSMSDILFIFISLVFLIIVLLRWTRRPAAGQTSYSSPSVWCFSSLCYWGGHVARQQVRHSIHLHQFSVSHHCAIEVDTSPGSMSDILFISISLVFLIIVLLRWTRRPAAGQTFISVRLVFLIIVLLRWTRRPAAVSILGFENCQSFFPYNCPCTYGVPQCAERTSLIGTTLAKLSKQLRNITYRQLFNKHTTLLSCLFLKMVVYCNKQLCK